MKLSSPFLSWKKAALVAVCMGMAISAIQYTPWYVMIEEKIAMPVNFQTRSWLGRGPGLDPRIKIYSYDDTSFDYIGDSDLAINEWAQVFKVFADRGAKTIVIDKFFDGKRPSEKESEEFRGRLSRLGVPVVAGVYLSSGHKTRGFEVDQSRFQSEDPAFSKAPVRDLRVYGPFPQIAPAFSHLGHFNYTGGGKVQSFVRIGEKVAVPHIGFFADQSFKFDSMPTTKNGVIQVNLDDPRIYKDSNWTLRDPVSVAMENFKKDMPIQEGDIVVILPGMYTGNLDQVETPFGKMAGGFLVTAVVNSVVTGKWLRYFEHEEVLIFAASLVAAFCAVFFSSGWSWLFLLLGIGSSVASGLALFAFEDLVVPWFLPTAAMFTSGIFCLSLKSRAFEQSSLRLSSALSGMVSKDRLRDIINHPEKLDLTPSERHLTVMFVDIVGFSIMAERLKPEEAFKYLRVLFSRLGSIVHQFGGVVDSTPGDGLLCYFGYNLDGRESNHHEDQALKCAIEIQRQSVKQILEALPKSEPTFPLRIGVNSDVVYVGDLGGMLQIKPTVIGHAVNFAKRLESSCDFFCIMLGQKTRKKLSKPTDFSYRVERRPIQIKHHAELIEAYEVDPFMHDLTLRNRALQAYRTYIGVERKTDRFHVPEDTQLTISCEVGVGVLTNFSETGLAVRMPQYLGKEVNLPVVLDSPGGKLADELDKRGLSNLVAEVRWGRPIDERYLHGLYVKNLNPKQRAILFDCLTEFINVKRNAAG